MNLLDQIKTKLFQLKNSPELRKSFIYIATSAIAYGIVFVQNFTLAFILPTSFFGKLSLIISLFTTLYTVLTFGLNAVALRFYFNKDYEEDPHKLVSHIGTMWVLLSSVLIVVLLVSGYWVLYINHILPIEFLSEFIIVVFAAWLFSFSEIFSNFFIASNRPWKYAVYLVSSKLLLFILLHASVLIIEPTPSLICISLFMYGALLFLAGVLVFKIFPVSKPTSDELKAIFLYSFPLMIYSLGGMGYSHGYRLIISKWLNLEQMAVFSMANQIASAYYLAAASSITGLYPKAYNHLKDSDGNPHSIRFYLKSLIIVGIGFLILIVPVSYLFLKFFKSGSYFSAFEILPILLAGQFVFFIYGYNYILCTFYNRTNILTYSMFAGVGTSLILAFFVFGRSDLVSISIPVLMGFIAQFTYSSIAVNRIPRQRN